MISTLLYATSSATPSCKVIKQQQDPTLGTLTVAKIGTEKNVCLTEPGYDAFHDSSESALRVTREALEACDKAREEWKSVVLQSSDSLKMACNKALAGKDSIVVSKDSTIYHLELQATNLDSVIATKDAIIINREEVIKACEDSKMSTKDIILYGLGIFAIGFVSGAVAF